VFPIKGEFCLTNKLLEGYIYISSDSVGRVYTFERAKNYNQLIKGGF
jgi:hypothetical protein